jgi:signal transduction histidine kinase
MSDIVWAINPKRDSLIDLTRRMRQHADELFTLRDIELRFSAPGAADNFRIGVDIRRDLLLIFKEAVNNAARHSRCSLVEIDLRVEGTRLVLAIIDNGIGFDSTRAGDGKVWEHAAARSDAAWVARNHIAKRCRHDRAARCADLSVLASTPTRIRR